MSSLRQQNAPLIVDKREENEIKRSNILTEEDKRLLRGIIVITICENVFLWYFKIYIRY